MTYVALGLVALVCAGLHLVRATPILGMHPADKPLKFALSIAAFLFSMSALLPALSVGAATRRTLAVTLSITMSAEMIVIALQALRGRRSHFNVEQPLDATVVGVMFAGIAVLLSTMIAIALLATLRPLATSALLAAAWRSALWLFLFAAVSGFGMGARARHTVGAGDGGPGMALTGWSTTHGDLRVSHFLSLHALQIIPLAAAAISRLPVAAGARGALLALVASANAAVAVWTWLRALADKPF